MDAIDTADREVFRRHGEDATLLVGGAAAILLQLADPRVAQGVARHSGFRDDPIRRLRATLDYAYAVGLGDDRLVDAVVREVNARHAPVRGGGDGSTPTYSAFDADAQRWVASTLLATALSVHERIAGPLPPETADAIVRGYRPLGARLQADAAGWPSTRTEFEAWWAERIVRLEVGDDARRLARDLLAHPGLPPLLRLALPPVRLLTAALLPDRIRAAYGFRTSRRVDRATDAWFRAIAIARRAVPAPIRRIPLRLALRRVRGRTH